MKAASLLKLVISCFSLLLFAGCTSHRVIDNSPSNVSTQRESYSIEISSDRRGTGDLSLILAFSGGGTRAAALAYGVLEELRDTTIMLDGVQLRLLDQVDLISSVSGGSFTSAYYGLYGDRIFIDFESKFLRRDINSGLIRKLLNPILLFSSSARTESAVRYYEDTVFHGATFADMNRANSPLILINATDLSKGVRFSFVQEYFSLLCSDILSFPVARAVTASAAVPVLFSPVVMENYQHCKETKPRWLVEAETRVAAEPDLTNVVNGLTEYYNEDRKFSHFIDGGITDNLGLRAIYEIIELSGGSRTFLKRAGRTPPHHFVVISIDASTDIEGKMDKSKDKPSLESTISAISKVQLSRYSSVTLELMEDSIARWSQESSTPKRRIKPFFIPIGLKDSNLSKKELQILNSIPTSFSLSNQQVDSLINAGHKLLRENQIYQELLTDLNVLQNHM